MLGVYSKENGEATTMVALLNEYFKEEKIKGCAFLLTNKQEVEAFKIIEGNEIIIISKNDRIDLIDEIKFDYVFFNDGKAYDMQRFAHKVIKSLEVC